MSPDPHFEDADRSVSVLPDGLWQQPAVSVPAPPVIWSLPPSPKIVSLPRLPFRKSLFEPPRIESLPWPPSRVLAEVALASFTVSSPTLPLTKLLPPPAKMLSLPWPPNTESLSAPPSRLSAPVPPTTRAPLHPPRAPPRPGAGTPSDYRFPHFSTRILANGLRLIVATVPAYPVVTTLAVIEAGATRDPRDYEGLAQLTTRALAEGTRDMNALELTSRLEMLGTTLDTGADWDSAIVQITALSSRIDDAVAVLSEVLRYPAFPESELERMRGERLADLAQLRAEPRGLSDVFFSRLLYKPESRFARLAGGDEQSIMRLTRERVQAYHAEFYRPDATALMMVGDIDIEHAVKLASAHFGDWAGKAPPVTEPMDTQRFPEARVHLVHKPDAPQSEVRVGHVAIPRLHEDYFPVVVMNAILGGLFSSRLNLNLREVHAYTYGAHSAFDWRRAASPFEISTAVETAVTADALREIALEAPRVAAALKAKLAG